MLRLYEKGLTSLIECLVGFNHHEPESIVFFTLQTESTDHLALYILC